MSVIELADVAALQEFFERRDGWLEYGPHVWLVGACVVAGPRRETVQLWADTPDEERRSLRALARLIQGEPGAATDHVERPGRGPP